MHAVRARLPGGADDLVGVEIGRDRDRAVGGPCVERPFLVWRGDCHRLHAEPLARAEDAGRDLATVRYEEPSDQHAPIVKKA